jgi:hypothetical protein
MRDNSGNPRSYPDLPKRQQSCWQRLPYGPSETVRVELTGEAGLAGKDTNPITAAEAPLQIERPIR